MHCSLFINFRCSFLNTIEFVFYSYPVDSVELQQRKLGDLAFLVQHYELAFNSYHAAKREFNNDRALVYFAGALVCCVLLIFINVGSRILSR